MDTSGEICLPCERVTPSLQWPLLPPSTYALSRLAGEWPQLEAVDMRGRNRPVVACATPPDPRELDGSRRWRGIFNKEKSSSAKQEKWCSRGEHSFFTDPTKGGARYTAGKVSRRAFQRVVGDPQAPTSRRGVRCARRGKRRVDQVDTVPTRVNSVPLQRDL